MDNITGNATEYAQYSAKYKIHKNAVHVIFYKQNITITQSVQALPFIGIKSPETISKPISFCFFTHFLTN